MRTPGNGSSTVQAPPNPLATLKHKYALTCPCQVRRARQPVVARPHNNCIPMTRGNLFERHRKPDFS